MPYVEESCLHQKAIIWTVSSFSRTGEKTVSSGTELSVRWEDMKLLEKQKGETEQFDAVVIVAQDVDPGTLIWEGGTADLPSPLSDITDLYEVKQFSKVKDIKGRAIRRVCGLMRYSDTMPTVS